MSLSNLVTHNEYVRLELVKQLIASSNHIPSAFETVEIMEVADKLANFVDKGLPETTPTEAGERKPNYAWVIGSKIPSTNSP